MSPGDRVIWMRRRGSMSKPVLVPVTILAVKKRVLVEARFKDGTVDTRWVRRDSLAMGMSW